ncbi:MAG: NAD(P)-dependent oxidoreductase [Sedimentisphaeraceae bacterium JB056]
MKTKVLIVDRVYKRSQEIFSQANDIEFIVVSKEEEQIAAAVKDNNANAVVLATDKYTGPLYDSLGQKALIARYGVGHDGIEKTKASQNNQYVTITPGVLDNSVAEHTIFLLGALARNIASSNSEIKNNSWKKTTGIELAGKTLSIIGCGAIGRRVAQIASFGLSMKVIAFDIAKLDAEKLKRDYGIQKFTSSLQNAISEADAVSIHLPAIEPTKDFVNPEMLSMMKKCAMLVNTSRGSIVDESALYDALSSGQIAGAAIDVYKKEPYEPQDSEKDLRKLDNIIMTPHLGSSTKDSSDRMAECVLKNIRLWREQDINNMDIVNTK